MFSTSTAPKTMVSTPKSYPRALMGDATTSRYGKDTGVVRGWKTSSYLLKTQLFNFLGNMGYLPQSLVLRGKSWKLFGPIEIQELLGAIRRPRVTEAERPLPPLTTGRWLFYQKDMSSLFRGWRWFQENLQRHLSRIDLHHRQIDALKMSFHTRSGVKDTRSVAIRQSHTE